MHNNRRPTSAQLITEHFTRYAAEEALLDRDRLPAFEPWDWDWAATPANENQPPKAAGVERLEPDRGQLETSIRSLFRHAAAGYWVSLRSFHDNGTPRIKPVKLNGDLGTVIDQAYREAKWAAQASTPVVFCPPIASFTNDKQARELDVAEGLVLSVECDSHVAAGREKTIALLGPPTLEVASGGEWTDPTTGEIEDKEHLHYRLSIPTRTEAEHQKLKLARKLIAKIAGADRSNIPLVHPIRWPGSWHRKKEPKLCRIIVSNPDVEIDLDTAVEILQRAADANSSGGTDSSDHFAAYAAETAYHSNWGELIGNVLAGEDLHDSLNRLGAKWIARGVSVSETGDFLRGLMEEHPVDQRDSRWHQRYKDIDRSLKTAVEKYGPEQQATVKPATPAEGDPVDLWAQQRVPPLPRGLLPKVIEEFAFQLGKLMGADPAGLATGALTVCAALIPDHIKLQPKRNDYTWKVSTRLWNALVGGVSTMKTPTMKQVMEPVVRIDAGLRQQYAKAEMAYEVLSSDEKKTTPKPILRRVRVEDVTPESAQEIFKDNNDGLLLSRDELSGWFGSMDKYAGGKGASSNRGFWLQAFNGGPYSTDRVGRGSGHVENLSISILGGIQPDTARKMFADGIDDGLVQRINPIMLCNRVEGLEEESAEPVNDQYQALVQELFELRNGFPTEVEHFDPEAAVIRRQLELEHLKLVEAFETVNKKLAAHVGKYDGMFASLCLLWHTIENLHEAWVPAVSADIAQRVKTFMHDFLLPHAIAFYRDTFGLADDHERLAAVAGYILAHKLERLTNRDVQRSIRTMRGCDRRDIERVLDQLDAFGWVTRVAGRRFDSPSWTVNPRVHTKFKEHAEWEANQRRQAQALMAEKMSSEERKVVELARHDASGYVLSAIPGRLKAPKLQLKLMRPGPVKKRLGEQARVWLQWDTQSLEWDQASCAVLENEPEEIQDWMDGVVRSQLRNWRVW